MTDSTATQSRVRRLVVIGLGLIGGSLASAARQRGICQAVWGVAPDEQVRARAMELGIVERAEGSIADLAADLGEGDLIFIAVPTLSVVKVLAQIAPCVSPAVTVTDGASVKGSVLADVRRVYGCVPAQVVLGHPIAGSEKSGVEAANPDLYERHRIILTPLPETGTSHLERVQSLWEAVGAEVLHLDVQQHDDILAATSHLPHAIAFSLVDTLAHDSQNQDIFRYAAGGFRDFTRIASSDATMWRDIMLANRQSVVKALDLFSANLDRLRQAIEREDEQQLLGIFTRAKAARDHFTRMLQHRAIVDAGPSRTVHLRVSPAGGLGGSLRLPGDKSISHRAVMLGALAIGVTEIHGFLQSEGALATLQALRDMGVVIVGPTDDKVVVHGVGLHGLQPPAGPLYLGNSGTSARLLAGILAGQAFDSCLTGGEALSRRSMAGIIAPLTRMGAVITAAAGSAIPLQIKGGQTLKGIEHRMPVASAQVKSSLLLAGLYAQGVTRITEPFDTRDHTERMLQGLGYSVTRDGASVALSPGGELHGCRIDVPADLTTAVFFAVAATVTPGSELTLLKVGVNSSRLGAVHILRLMGADIVFSQKHTVSGEPVADICVRSASLQSVAVAEAYVASAIDELPVLLAAAACAEGVTQFSGATRLGLADNQRVCATLAGLQDLGVDCGIDGDLLSVRGGPIQQGEVDSRADSRTAMALTVAGLRAKGPVVIRNCVGVVNAFPEFTAMAQAAGISLEAVNR